MEFNSGFKGLKHARVLIFLLMAPSAKELGDKISHTIAYCDVILNVCIILFMQKMVKSPRQQM